MGGCVVAVCTIIQTAARARLMLLQNIVLNGTSSRRSSSICCHIVSDPIHFLIKLDASVRPTVPLTPKIITND
uniref:Putative secreted protein n=1 Tax=Anopheles darlingi TaxID=43151 RepID=A0A2M4DJ01_ANODA